MLGSATLAVDVSVNALLDLGLAVWYRLAGMGHCETPRRLGEEIMDTITLEDMANLLINVGLDDGCDYDAETMQIILEGLWVGDGGGGFVCPAVICIVELLKEKATDDEFARVRRLVLEGMTDEESVYDYSE